MLHNLEFKCSGVIGSNGLENKGGGWKENYKGQSEKCFMWNRTHLPSKDKTSFKIGIQSAFGFRYNMLQKDGVISNVVRRLYKKTFFGDLNSKQKHMMPHEQYETRKGWGQMLNVKMLHSYRQQP
eukprot:TRINITY_DN682_c0_g1_i11.p1 TRINITY_DN682_c0_g1~~TRINITY_DN682_c0_g1_i11.p1  ORF type:complete len:125 (-),score=18.98 TRINITY_DN682_c0_g1_i11:7-381(-)